VLKRIFFVLVCFSSSLINAQTGKKIGFYSTLDANLATDLVGIIQPEPKTPYKTENAEAGKFTYGASALVGYQPLSWFSVAGGLRYSYVLPNFHFIYYKLQTNFYVGSKFEEDLTYIFANFGEIINRTAVESAGFFGFGVGKIEPLGSRFGHHFQLGLDLQSAGEDAVVFVGFSYGIILFSNKKF